jgi:hypothetical protein
MTNPTGSEGQNAPDLSSGQTQMSAGERLDELNRKKFEKGKAMRAGQREVQLRQELWARKEKREQEEPVRQLRNKQRAQNQMQAALTKTWTTLATEWTQAQAEPAHTGQYPGSNARGVDPARVADVQKEREQVAAERRDRSQERGGQGNDR